MRSARFSVVTFVPVFTRLRTERRMQQKIRYLTTRDGVQLAWASMGSGPPLIKAANWLTHLQYDVESPVWAHWLRFFSQHFHFIRYDERGCGMTQWRTPDLSHTHWIDDLEAVAAAAEPERPAILLGISQGAAVCVEYAVRHPERVSHLILYGGYAKGWRHREDATARQRYEAVVDLIRLGWGTDNAAFREVFTSSFVPDGSREQLDWWNELCRRTTTPEIAAHLMAARAEVDVRRLLSKVRTPTLVLHASEDHVTPIAESRELAAGIPNAQFVRLESRNHVLLEHEPAWARFKEAVLEFTGRMPGKPASERSFDALSPRERDVLSALIAGRSNAEIASSLHLSDKTVRNMLTRIFDKLQVKSRAQAIVYARDHGFGQNA